MLRFLVNSLEVTSVLKDSQHNFFLRMQTHRHLRHNLLRRAPVKVRSMVKSKQRCRRYTDTSIA